MMFKDHKEIGSEHDTWVKIAKGRVQHWSSLKWSRISKIEHFCKHREIIQFHKNAEFINQNNKYNDCRRMCML